MTAGASRETDPLLPPRMTVPTIDSVCSGMGKGGLVSGFLIDVLRKHFSTPANIEFDELRRGVWSAGETTDIVIQSALEWEPTTSGHRSAVLVRRNKLKTVRVSIGNRVHNEATPEGFPKYTLVLAGTYTIFCLAGKPLQAEILASEVFREMVRFKEQLMKTVKLLDFNVEELDGPGLLEETKQHFVVPVNLFVAFSESWIVTSNALPLRKISVNALLQQ